MDNKLKGKRILLLYAKFFNYDVVVLNKLRELGAIVDLYDARAEVTAIEKAILKAYKGFFYRKLINFHNQIQINNQNKEYDYIFTNSYLPVKVVDSYRRFFPTAKLILYLDDSVDNTSDVENTFDCYDIVKTFDRSDAIRYNLQLQPLFFEDSYKNNNIVRPEYDVCFIGTIHSDRLKIILEIEKICRRENLKFIHYDYLQSKFIYYFYWLTKKEFRMVRKDFFSFSPLESSEVARIVARSRCVLDIQHPLQSGLTMRTIETIGAGKKIITTNADIKNYDICSNNVAIIDRNHPQISKSFIRSDYCTLDSDILIKYSITGWIKSIFN